MSVLQLTSPPAAPSAPLDIEIAVMDGHGKMKVSDTAFSILELRIRVAHIYTPFGTSLCRPST